MMNKRSDHWRRNSPFSEEQQERLRILCASHNKALAQKLLFAELALAVIGGLMVSMGILNGDRFILSWMSASLVNGLFMIPVAVLTLWSFLLRGSGSVFAEIVTALARILAIFVAVFWILTFVFSLFGDEPNLFMSIWCLIETAANLVPFILSFRSKSLGRGHDSATGDREQSETTKKTTHP